MSYIQQELGDMHRSIQVELLEKGYSKDSKIIVVKSDIQGGVKYVVYDADSGKPITSRTIDAAGNWK